MPYKISKKNTLHKYINHSMIFKTITNPKNEEDIIKMDTDAILTDKNGNIIEIKVPRPEYFPEIFSWKKWR